MPQSASHQVVHFYAGQWCTFTPALTGKVGMTNALRGIPHLEHIPTILTHSTGFSRLLARHGRRRGRYDHKRAVTTSGGREKPASGGLNQPIGVVTKLAR